MGLSDALAGFVGERFGRHNIVFLGNKKSAEGSTAFFICTLILTVLFLPTLGYHVVLIPAILTVVEFSMTFGLDNLVLPILGAALFELFM